MQFSGSEGDRVAKHRACVDVGSDVGHMGKRVINMAIAALCLWPLAIAPATSNPNALERQGRLIQIARTGNAIDGKWGIWNRQVAVDALWLARHVDVKLLSSDDPFQQFIQWRDYPPIEVAAFWNEGGFQRFVSIMPLTEAWDWQFEANGDRLFLQIPDAPLAELPLPQTSPTPETPTFPDLFPPPIELAWLPGIEIARQTSTFGDRQVSVAIAEIDLSQPSLSLRPFWAVPDRLEGIRDTRSASLIQGAAIAINGGFFNRKTQQPLGALRRDGEWISSPILGRGVAAWNDTGEFFFARLDWQEIATVAGADIELTHLNSGFAQAGWSRYSPEWGDRYVSKTDGEAIVTVLDGEIADIQAAEAAGSMAVDIPEAGYLLVARREVARDRALMFQVGEAVELVTRPEPSEVSTYDHAIGGGPLLMQDGQIVLDAALEQFQAAFQTQKAARSAIGRTAEGKILLVTAGKGKEFSGITLGEMALLMQRLGCEDALNLDGVRVHQADLLSPQTYAGLLKDVEAVFHLAGATKAVSSSAFRKSNVDVSRTLASVLARQRRPPILIHVSSLAAAGPS
ncbi:MAG: phosphodiester glycosidase family protein, partial [Cyanobacteria bacterium J06639_1]